MNKKRAEIDMAKAIGIGLLLLLLVGLGYLAITGSLNSFGEHIKNLFRFGQ